MAESVVVATSTSTHDNPIQTKTAELGCRCYRGSEHDVLERFIQAGESVWADAVVRITADCPFIDPEVVDGTISYFKEEELDYAGCVHVRSFPRGLDVEVIKLSALRLAFAATLKQHHREHVTPFLYEHPEMFRIAPYVAEGGWHRPDLRFCLDSPEDLVLLREIHDAALRPAPEALNVASLISEIDESPNFKARMKTAEDWHHQKNLSEGIQHTTNHRYQIQVGRTFLA